MSRGGGSTSARVAYSPAIAGAPRANACTAALRNASTAVTSPAGCTLSKCAATASGSPPSSASTFAARRWSSDRCPIGTSAYRTVRTIGCTSRSGWPRSSSPPATSSSAAAAATPASKLATTAACRSCAATPKTATARASAAALGDMRPRRTTTDLVIASGASDPICDTLLTVGGIPSTLSRAHQRPEQERIAANRSVAG